MSFIQTLRALNKKRRATRRKRREANSARHEANSHVPWTHDSPQLKKFLADQDARIRTDFDDYTVKMRLGVSYNVFDGEELLEPSILAIRDAVDHISVVYQEVSNTGNRCAAGLVALVQDLHARGLVDEIHHYTPDLDKHPTLNEMAKRNIGLDIATAAGASHFLSLDTDEFYDFEAFIKAKKIIEHNNIKGSAVYVKNYFKTPEYLMVRDEGFVSFIYKIEAGKTFTHNAKFPVLVDSTRTMKTTKDYYIFEHNALIMDHMSMVRKNIRAKLENSSANALFQQYGIDKYIEYFENWTPPQPMYKIHQPDIKTEIKIVPDKYNIKKFL